MIAVLALLLSLFSVQTSIGLVSEMFPKSWLEKEMSRTCHRESRCKAIGVHRRDLHASRLMWRRAVKAGWLNPDKCKYHRLNAGPWSPSGPFGASRAYTWHHIGSPCIPIEYFDIPIINTIAVAKRMISIAGKRNKRRNIREAWKGRGNVRRKRRGQPTLESID